MVQYPSFEVFHPMQRKITALIFILAGLSAASTALLANILGLTSSATWGGGRRGLLILGLALLASPYILRLSRAAAAHLNTVPAWRKLTDWLRGRIIAPISRAAQKLSRTRLYHWLSDPNPRLSAVSSALIALGVVLIYAWIGSVGRWTDWPATTDYYNQLASSFLQGRLYLLFGR